MSNKNKNKQTSKPVENPAEAAVDDNLEVEVYGEDTSIAFVDLDAEEAPTEEVAEEEVMEEELPKEEVKEVVEEKKAEEPVEKPKNIKDIKNTFSNAEAIAEKKVVVSSSIAPGMQAKIKGTATNTFTGSIIPPVARNKKYTVTKVQDGRVIMVAGTYSIALKEQDVLIV